MNWKKWRIAVAVLLFAGVCLTAAFFRSDRDTVLEFGMFAGSNWDVANADSCIIIDKAIKKFEKTHPGVRIHYYSGIPKNDYSEWLARKILNGETPDVFMILSNDFDKLASLGLLASLDDRMSQDENTSESGRIRRAGQ